MSQAVSQAVSQDYATFLASKRVSAQPSGFTVSRADLPPALFAWQAEIVVWACQRGRAALFEECGIVRAYATWVQEVNAYFWRWYTTYPLPAQREIYQRLIAAGVIARPAPGDDMPLARRAALRRARMRAHQAVQARRLRTTTRAQRKRGE